MPHAKVRGLDIYYEVKGEGRPLVMIMGLGANADWWETDTVAALARDFRLLLFDNRDAGRTSASAGPYTIKDMADDTVALMDHVGMSRAHVLGVSMGGMIAQELVLNYPRRVDRLILGCTSPGQSLGIPPGPEVMADLLTSRESLPPAEMAQRLLRILFSPEWVAANQQRLPEALMLLGAHPITQEGYLRQLMAIAGFDTGPRLGQIKAPTLVLHGTRDVLVPPENGRILNERIAGSRLELFEGAGHAFMSEQPDRFLAVVRDFLMDRST